MTKKIKVEDEPGPDLSKETTLCNLKGLDSATSTSETNSVYQHPVYISPEKLQHQIQDAYLACLGSVHAIKATNEAKPTAANRDPLVCTAEDALDILIVGAVTRLERCGYGVRPTSSSLNEAEDLLPSVQQMAKAMALEFTCEHLVSITAAWACWKGAGSPAPLDEATQAAIANDCTSAWAPYRASPTGGTRDLFRQHRVDQLQLPQMEAVLLYIYEECHEAVRAGDSEPSKLIAALAVRHLERIGYHRGLVLRALAFEAIDAPGFSIRKAWDIAEQAGWAARVKREIKLEDDDS